MSDARFTSTDFVVYATDTEKAWLAEQAAERGLYTVHPLREFVSYVVAHAQGMPVWATYSWIHIAERRIALVSSTSLYTVRSAVDADVRARLPHALRLELCAVIPTLTGTCPKKSPAARPVVWTGRTRFPVTVGAVEATPVEQEYVRAAFADAVESWFDDEEVHAFTVGTLDGQPVVVHCRWAQINAGWICFYHPASDYVDWTLVYRFIRERCEADVRTVKAPHARQLFIAAEA